jgi:flagellar export protein FliJ
VATRPFRFRAAAALDLRIKEEDHAKQQLARAQSAHEATALRAVQARHRADAAADEFVMAQRTGTDAARLAWHQSWIVRLRLEADAARGAAATSAASLERATASVNVARQRRRTLERLRDRAKHRYDEDARRHDTRDMNELASVRFAARLSNRGGTSGDRSRFIDD